MPVCPNRFDDGVNSIFQMSTSILYRTQIHICLVYSYTWSIHTAYSMPVYLTIHFHFTQLKCLIRLTIQSAHTCRALQHTDFAKKKNHLNNWNQRSIEANRRQLSCKKATDFVQATGHLMLIDCIQNTTQLITKFN